MTLKLHQILVVVRWKSLDRRNQMQQCMGVIAYALYVRFPFSKVKQRIVHVLVVIQRWLIFWISVSPSNVIYP